MYITRKERIENATPNYPKFHESASIKYEMETRDEIHDFRNLSLVWFLCKKNPECRLLLPKKDIIVCDIEPSVESQSQERNFVPCIYKLISFVWGSEVFELDRTHVSK